MMEKKHLYMILLQDYFTCTYQTKPSKVIRSSRNFVNCINYTIILSLTTKIKHLCVHF